MAIKFTSNHPDISDELIIGGKDTAFTGNEKGGYGPFPSYSISREDIYTEDQTYLTSKYSINITGFATIKPSDNVSALSKGGRQSKIQGEKIIKLQFNRSKWPMIGAGTLEIEAYDASSTLLKFYDARLISVDTPEQDETSSDINYTQYNFSFEAYNLNDNPVADSFVSSVSESWDFAVNENQFSFLNDNINSTPYKTYTLSHSLSATGIRRYNGSSIASEAWKEAEKWIKDRIIDLPNANTEINKHVNNKNIDQQKSKFAPFYMNTLVAPQEIKIDISGSSDGVRYKAYNHSRNVTVDNVAGIYTVTDSWVLALETSTAIHELSATIDNNQDAAAIAINVQGTIQGLNSNTEYKANNAYNNAKSTLSRIEPYIFQYAQGIYNNISNLLKDPTKQLRNVINKRSIGHNPISGTITWSLSYNDETILGDQDKIASESINITYDNNDRSSQLIAIIPVIGRPAGPVIQRFNTNKERKVSVNLDLVMKPNHREDAPPTQIGQSIVDQYKPDGGNVYINSRTENWNKKTGTYNLSIEWVY